MSKVDDVQGKSGLRYVADFNVLQGIPMRSLRRTCEYSLSSISV